MFRIHNPCKSMNVDKYVTCLLSSLEWLINFKNKIINEKLVDVDNLPLFHIASYSRNRHNIYMCKHEMKKAMNIYMKKYKCSYKAKDIDWVEYVVDQFIDILLYQHSNNKSILKIKDELIFLVKSQININNNDEVNLKKALRWFEILRYFNNV